MFLIRRYYFQIDLTEESFDTADLIGNWTTGPNSFAVDPPNVALIVDDDKIEQSQDLAVIELFNPEYDSEMKEQISKYFNG
jgi:hypothetical protein